MTKSSLLLQALIEQIPEMGEFYISEDDDVKEVLWIMFRVKWSYSREELDFPNGHYMYRYILEDDDFPMDGCDTEVINEDGDRIYLYLMDE